jgi:predicted DCC family thiol-disulfide oxidoreductase YuxK
MSETVTVWFDSECPLCLREISLMRRLDRRGAIRFVDIQGGSDCPLDPEVLLARFHAREGDGELVSGAAAFAAMWRAIPILRPLGLAARVPPVAWLLERAYLGFLKARPWLQRQVSRMEGSPAGN